MPRIIKFIFFLLLFGVLFEAGLLSSYTIVTSEPPDIGNLIDMQTSKLTAIWESIGIGSGDNSTNTLKILNADPVAQTLKSKTGLNGINIQSMSAKAQDSSVNDNITVDLTATGYKENQTGGVTSKNGTSSGQIVITPSETYSLTAIAMGKKKSRGVEIDVNTIKVTSLKKIYAK